MIKKVISCFILASVVMVSFSTPANASVVRGKKYYIKYLKDACGFKGDVMGKHHTKKEWRDAYRSSHLNMVIKKICPNAPSITSKKKQKHLYHFLSSFASDSGNIPSCN